ncbi:hypothetical protein ACFVZ3_10095 [Kitasatospora purpeofusca]|uniref:hypothetical protein n=1 Tax=Kitasatospora purpeofusca TaxID=67352 RepID=UPI0036B1167F
MTLTLARPWRRGNLPAGVTGVAVVVVVIIVGSFFAPALLDGPIVLTAAKAAVATGISYFTMNGLRSRKRVRWHLGR